MIDRLGGWQKLSVRPREISRDSNGSYRFRLTGDHPHAGRECVVRVNDNDTVTVHNIFGDEMYKVEFSDDLGGAAFAKRECLNPIWK